MKALCPNCQDPGEKRMISISFTEKPKWKLTRNLCDSCDRACYFGRPAGSYGIPVTITRKQYQEKEAPV